MADKAVILQQTHTTLEKMINSKGDALPKDFNQTKFIQNCMTVLQDTYNIENCKPITIARTMLKGAFLGLDFFMKECYAIPYKGELNFQTDYKGEIKLAKKYSINPIKDIYAKLVREEDLFEEEIKNGQQTINFKPKSFNNNPIVGAFAVCLFQDNSMIYETMSTEEIEKIKETFSQKSFKTNEYSKAWKETPGEMYKKTVLRRLCKLIQLDFESIEQKKIFDESSGMEIKEDNKPIEKSNFEFVDTDFEEVTEEKEGEQIGIEQE